MNTNLAHAAQTPLASSSVDHAAPTRFIRALGGIIFYALLVLMALVAIPYGTAEPWWEAFFECAVFALALLWIVEGLLSGSWLTKHRSLWLPVLALIAFCIFQSLPLWTSGGDESARLGHKILYAVSADPFETKRFTLKLVALALYGLLLTRYGSSVGRLRTLVHVIIAVALASALFGMLRQTTQHEMGFFLPFLKKGIGYGQFINQNHFAFLMEMDLGLVLGMIVGRGVRRDRMLLYLATLLPVWMALVLSNSRGGLLGMLGQLIFVALLFTILPPAKETEGARGREEGTRGRLRRLGRSLPVRIALAGCLLLAIAVGVFLVGGEPMMGKLENVQTELNSSDAPVRQNASRKEIWSATWKLIKAHPVAGVGFGGYWAIIPTYHDASGELTPQQAHNDYLELLASGGIIGVAIMCWFAYVFLRRVRERLRQPISPFCHPFCRALCFGALAGLFGIAVHSIVDFGLHITINALVFVALLVLATADCHEREANSHMESRHRSTGKTSSTAISV